MEIVDVLNFGQRGWEWLSSQYSFIREYFVPAGVGIGIALLILVLVELKRNYKKLLQVLRNVRNIRYGGMPMTKRTKRKVFVKQQISQGISDFLDDLVYRNVLTTQEHDYWAKLIGVNAHLPDLVPQHYLGTPKEAINKRLGKHKPVALPDAVTHSTDPSKELAGLLL